MSLKQTEISFDYFMIHTGYTARTVKHYVNLGATIQVIPQDRLMFELNSDTIEDEEYSVKQNYKDREYDNEPTLEEYQDRFEDGSVYMPVFIKDELWGDGLYKFDAANADVKLIVDTLDKFKIYYEGSICFKVTSLYDAFELVEFVRRLDYCACFGSTPYEMETMEIKDKNKIIKILVMNFDCESG